MNSGGWGSILSVSNRSHLDNSGVDAATNAVLHLDVEFGNDVGFEGSVLLEIFLGGCVNNVTDGESLDGLVLRASSSAVDAHNSFDVASIVFVSAVISSLSGHMWLYLYQIYIFN